MTRRLELSFTNMSHKIKPFRKKRLEELIFWKDQSNIETLFWWLKELSFLKNMTHRTEPIFTCDSLNWTLLSNMTHRDWTLLFYTSQRKMTPLFSMTQRIFPFYKMYDSKNKLIVLAMMTQRVELFWRKNDSFYWTYSKRLRIEFWKKVSPNWTLVKYHSKFSQKYD